MNKKILLIVFMAFMIRFVNAGAPIIGVQQWRQCDTAAIARNFYESGMDIFHPRIDWGGSSPGFVESEFQLYPFIVALLYKAFGFHEFLGRLVSIIFSVFAVYYLYLLSRDTFGERVAEWACLIYSVLPLNAFYASSFQPESAFMAFSIAGIYYLCEWSRSENSAHLLFSAVLISLACLLKLTNLYLGLPLLYTFLKKYGRNVLARKEFWFYGAIALLPVVAWYRYSHNIYLSYGLTFGIWDYGSGKWLNSDFLKFNFWYSFLFISVIVKHFALFGAPLFAAGLFYKEPDGRRPVTIFDIWLVAFVIYVFIAARGHFLHEYYQLPLCAIGSAYIGRVFAENFQNGRALRLYLIAIILTGIFIYGGYIRLQDPASSPELALASVAREKINDKKPVIYVSSASIPYMFASADPVFLYHARMKGWIASAEEANQEYVSDKVKSGAGHLIGYYGFFAGPRGAARLKSIFDGNYKKIYDDGEKFIVRLYR